MSDPLSLPTLPAALPTGTTPMLTAGSAFPKPYYDSTSTGNSLIDAPAAVTAVGVQSGSLTTGVRGTFSNLPSVQVEANASWLLAGNQRIGSLGGAGQVLLDANTLRTGAGANTRFDGSISGTGSLVKEGGSSFTLSLLLFSSLRICGNSSSLRRF